MWGLLPSCVERAVWGSSVGSSVGGTVWGELCGRSGGGELCVWRAVCGELCVESCVGRAVWGELYGGKCLYWCILGV